MSKPKFTPGPWFRVGRSVRWKKEQKDLPYRTLPNGLICSCKSAEAWPECDEEARANAQLISAAPEMYEMLASIRTTLEYMGYLPYLVKDIDLILRKARGESEVSE